MRRIHRSIRVQTLRAAAILKRAAAIFAAALAVRVLFTSALAQNVQHGLRAAGESAAFARAVLAFELPPDTPPSMPAFGWNALFTGQSAVFAVSGQESRADAAVSSDENWQLPPLLLASPAPTPAASEPTTSPVSPSPAVTPVPETRAVSAITVNPSSPDGYDYFSGVYIKNDTSFTIDVETALKNEPSVSLASKGAQVLIIHTHGSESYLPDDRDSYVPTDIQRTEDTNFNVVRVGDEIEKVLKAKGLSVLHDRGIYDFPTYSGSYTRTLEAIAVHLKKNPTIKVVIDVHRDAMEASDGTIYKTVADVGGKKAAQVMLVMGTGQSGLSHPGWKNNLRLAVRIQKQMTDKYPNLARPINLRKERFNQHATPGSMLVEVGTSANSLEEALTGARMFADAAGEVLKKYKK